MAVNKLKTSIFFNILGDFAREKGDTGYLEPLGGNSSNTLFKGIVLGLSSVLCELLQEEKRDMDRVEYLICPHSKPLIFLKSLTCLPEFFTFKEIKICLYF